MDRIVIECRNTETIQEDRMLEVHTMLVADLAKYVSVGTVYVGRSDACHSGYQSKFERFFVGKKREKAIALLADIEKAICEGRVIDTFSRMYSLYR